MAARSFHNPLALRLLVIMGAASATAALVPGPWYLRVLGGMAIGVSLTWLLIGRLPELLDALSDALCSLRENDYGARLDEKRSGLFQPLAAEFNALAAALRGQR